MHVGFVGTGNMGEPMALNVLKAGHQLTVYDRRPEATAELERRGARRAADLVALGREVRATLLSLPDERVVETVVFGERPGAGLIDGSRAGDVIIDLSTVSPSSTRRLAARTAERGITLIDAPVSGSVGGARAGTLAVMIGATESMAKPFAPVLSAIGTSLFFWARRAAATC
jgi:3-hydroxyisobutyrate dehydrogenase